MSARRCWTSNTRQSLPFSWLHSAHVRYGHFDQRASHLTLTPRPTKNRNHRLDTDASVPGQAASSSNVGRCRLWENQQEQKDQEAVSPRPPASYTHIRLTLQVVRARDEARAEAVKRATEEGIQLAEEDLNVEAPPVPANSLPGHRQRVPIPAARPLAAAFGPPLNYVAQPDALPVLARANPGTVQERGPDGVPMWRQYLGGMIQARNPPEPVPGPVWAHNPFGAFVARPGFPRVIAPLPARTMNLAGAAPPSENTEPIK